MKEPKPRGLPPQDNIDETAYYFIREHNDQAVALREEGELEEAISSYDKVLSIKGDVAVVYNNRGVAWLEKGNLDRAVSDFDQAVAVAPDFAAPYYNRGIVRRKKKNSDRRSPIFRWHWKKSRICPKPITTAVKPGARKAAPNGRSATTARRLHWIRILQPLTTTGARRSANSKNMTSPSKTTAGR